MHADDLHAYADGSLDAARMAEVEAWLERDPQAAAAVRAFLEQRELLHAAFDPVLDEPLPEQLARRFRSRR